MMCRSREVIKQELLQAIRNLRPESELEALIEELEETAWNDGLEAGQEE